MRIALIAIVFALTACAAAPPGQSNTSQAMEALGAYGNAVQGRPAPSHQPTIHCWKDVSGENTYCQ